MFTTDLDLSIGTVAAAFGVTAADANEEFDEDVLLDDVDANEEDVDIVDEDGFDDDVNFESTSSQSPPIDECNVGVRVGGMFFLLSVLDFT